MGLTWSPSSANVYTQVSGTIVFNDDDVQWVYVDWDDGEDNSLENAIFQWERLDTDSNSIILSHTYTKADTFYPVLRTVNNKGFLSKYLYSGGTVTDLPQPNELITGITSITIADGNPTSVMRIENKQVLSGIDNNIFNEGPKELYVMIPPLLADDDMAAIGASINLEITGVLQAVTYNDELPAGTYDDVTLGTEKIVTTHIENFDSNASPSATPAATRISVSGGLFSEILSVKWANPKLISTTNSVVNNYNKLKVFLIAKSNDGSWYPITYVSNGDPFKSIDDVKRTSTLDFSQSRAKASNKSISYYKYDSGKVWWQPTLQWQASSSTQLNDNTKISDSLLKKNYTYYTRPTGLLGSGSLTAGEKSVGFYSGNAWSYGAGVGVTYKYIRDQFPLNEFNQFYDQYALTRLEAVSDSDKYSGLDTFGSVYRIRPVTAPTGAAGYDITPVAVTPSETSVHTSGSWLNGDPDGSVPSPNMTDWNVGPFTDSNGALRRASEYWMVTNDTKFGKVFFNNTMYSPEMETNLAYNSGSNIAGVYYLRVSNEKFDDKFTQKAEWVPLKFEDTTTIEKEYRDSDNSKYVTKGNTMCRSGYIEFDIPSDWSNVTHVSGLTGGFFDNGTDVKAEASDWSIAVTAEKGVSVTNTPFDTFVLTGATGLTSYTSAEIGKYKCVYHINTGADTDDNGKVFWVASSSADGTELYLASGTSATLETAAAGAITGYIRRINIYDVFDGASKTSDIGNVPGYINAAMPTLNWDYTFQLASGTTGGQAFITEVKNNFSGYPLKIVISGAANHFISGSGQPGIQPWNMFPISQPDSQIVVQKDNTAYDLTYLEITSDVGVSYGGTYYQAISKGGKVFIVRTGTPIQTITFGGTALGDETQFKYNAEFTSYGTLRLLKKMQSESIRVMWDEVQKDGTYARFFGYVTTVTQSHAVGGPRAPTSFGFSMVVEEMCLIDSNGDMMSEIIPLGGVKDASNFK
jgi:hypothetical protein